jgi:NAD(P)-dependent dehydrogenase (short-subunit alcohol dehydrogenase family)
MPFGFESTTDDVLTGVDLSGKRIVVTGASAGLGIETVRALASRGAHITMAARDPAKAERAADEVTAALGGRPIGLEIRSLDLGSLASVRAFADGFVAEHHRLDALINNAGVMACPYGHTTDGFETQFGTNHLGHFLLAELLTPALEAAAPSRVVMVSSRGHAFADVDLDDPNFERTPYEPFVAYGRSKTANALHAVGYDARRSPRGIHAFSVHPGGIRTELGRHMTPETRAALGVQMAAEGRSFRWKTTAQGAATSCWAATASELDAHGGAYLEDCSVAAVSDEGALVQGVRAYALDSGRADALWELSERLTAAR